VSFCTCLLRENTRQGPAEVLPPLALRRESKCLEKKGKQKNSMIVCKKLDTSVVLTTCLYIGVRKLVTSGGVHSVVHAG
jgi:hypothetical protein